jgi:hypothetical protein
MIKPEKRVKKGARTMNKKALCIAILLTGLFGMLIFACQDKNSAPSGDSAQNIEEKASADSTQNIGEKAPADSIQNIEEKAPAVAASVEMHGMLERSESGGLLLADGQDRYDLKSDSDLSNLIGRQVKVTGTMKIDGSGRFIQVVQALEAPAQGSVYLTE